VLGAALVNDNGLSDAQIFAIARLIGAAAARTTRSAGFAVGEHTPMLSVRGLERSHLDAVIADAGVDVEVAIHNGRRRFILSGTPDDLGVVEQTVLKLGEKDAAELASKTRGGAPLSPQTEYSRSPSRSTQLHGARGRAGRRLGRALRTVRRGGFRPCRAH
jgi:fatty acid synthase